MRIFILLNPGMDPDVNFRPFLDRLGSSRHFFGNSASDSRTEIKMDESQFLFSHPLRSLFDSFVDSRKKFLCTTDVIRTLIKLTVY